MRQFKRVRPVLLLLVLLAFLPATVRADHRGELEDAKRDLERAKRRYAHAAAAVDAARCALDQARAARDSAARDLRHTTESIYQLESWLAGAEDDLRQAQAELAHVEQELAARRSAADETERLVNESAAVLRQIREQARAAFEESPEHVEARDAILRLQGRLDDAVEAVHQRLATDPAYAQLIDAARRAEADVERLRDDPRVRPEELAPVSQAWIDAKATVQRYEDQAVDADPQVQNARAALDVEMDRREALVRAFEQSLAADPQFVAADQRFRDAERARAEALDALRDVQGAHNDVASRLASLQSQFERNRSTLASAHGHADHLRRAIDAAEHDARRAEHELSYALSALADADRARDAAECRVRDLLEICRREDEEQKRRHETEDRGDRYRRSAVHGPQQDPQAERRKDEARLEDERRAERARREAEWRKSREASKRQPEPAETKKTGPEPKESKEPRRPEPKREEAKKEPKREEPKREEPKRDDPKKDEPKRDDPRKSDSKDRQSTEDRGDRHRKGK